ncbi:MAG: hypothetical protein JWR08_2351 [Enterovirga sp.]|nr:hypothetical protein [Enterovirga sp.]
MDTLPLSPAEASEPEEPFSATVGKGPCGRSGNYPVAITFAAGALPGAGHPDAVYPTPPGRFIRGYDNHWHSRARPPRQAVT